MTNKVLQALCYIVFLCCIIIVAAIIVPAY